PMIPPGLPMIFYGIAVGVSIIDLFMAGLLPGIMIAVGTMVIWAFVAKKEKYVGEGSFSFRRALVETKNSILALIFPIIILVGIRFGVFTPTEAGAVAVVYAFIITGFVYKEIRWSEMGGILSRTAVSTAVVILIAGMSRVVAHYVTIARIPHLLTEALLDVAQSPLEFMLILNISLLFVGMVMDITPAILLLGPILAPLGDAYGFDPVHFGLIVILNLVIGLLTPPVGTVLFVGSRLSGINMLELSKHMLPYLLMMVVVLAAVILFPQVFLFLPRLGR
ncbi:MAG TPA: TRAP transporter large permease, partial [Magnetospirillaceae bacterium]|nr:TRAP transporter large permease [Magnetospirillaceae bacterium]